MVGRSGSKRKGNAYEREVKRRLEKKGLFVARQTASITPDIIVIEREGKKVWFIECKSRKYLTPEERMNYRNYQLLYNVKIAVAFPEKVIKNKKKSKAILIQDFEYKETYWRLE